MVPKKVLEMHSSFLAFTLPCTVVRKNVEVVPKKVLEMHSTFLGFHVALYGSSEECRSSSEEYSPFDRSSLVGTE